MTPTTMSSAAPGFVLWCPTHGPLDDLGNPIGLAFQLDPEDPLADAEAGCEAEKVWGYLHKVSAPDDTVALCRVPEHPEDIAAGKPRCFSGVALKLETGKPAKVEAVAPAPRAVVGGTATWDAERKVLDRKAKP